MKNSNKSRSILLLMFLLAARTLFAQHHMTPGLSNDTMLFDGENSIYSPENKSDACKFKVTYLKGKVEGTTNRLKLIFTCGKNEVWETGMYELNEGDEVEAASVIKTGNNSLLELTAPDGSVMRFGQNTIGDIQCLKSFDEVNQKISMKLVLGTIWSHVTHALGGDNAMEVQTERAAAGVRGTTFSYEVKQENGNYTDILRTYEGKVEFSSRLTGKIDEEEIKRRSKELQDDLNAGKISLDEFTSKIKELTDPAQDLVKKNMVMIGAGEESIVRGNELPTAPAKFVEDSDAWYLDKNFSK